MSESINGQTVIVAHKEHASADLSEEVVLLNLRDGIYYGLQSVGRRIWELVQQPRSVGEIQRALLDEYAVAPERCEADLVTFLAELHEHGLVEIKRPA